MKTMHDTLSWNHPNRDKFEELCCLSVMGNLGREDRLFLDEHVKNCEDCRNLVSEFERIVLFELPSVAALRTENLVPESLEFSGGDQLRAKVLEKAKAALEKSEGQSQIGREIVLHWPANWWTFGKRSAGPALLLAGWSFAAVLLFLFFGKSRPTTDLATSIVESDSAQARSSDDVRVLESRALLAEKQRDEATENLNEANALARDRALNLAQMTAKYKNLDATYSAIETEFSSEQALLKQRAGELELTRRSLNEEIAARESLQGQLSEADERLEKNAAEVASLKNIASTTPAVLPTSEKSVDGNEAKEILGARDLHIVDVYDVNNAGKSSQAYGRVYYVNRSLLVFYAFDLSKVDKNHKSVAFQAWGFRQPKSTTAESLGLFYMDNAVLNRWTLRVSDPQLLSRIDTLFVTAEPPGGSHSPKGRRLLMASLAGPANHP